MEMTNENTTDLQKELRKTVVLAWAMVGSILMVLAAGTIIGMQNQPFTGFSAGAAPPKDAFFIGGLIAFIGIRMVRNAILKGAGADREARLNRLKTATMISLAMTEIPAVLGLVSFLLTGNTQELYIMVALSIAAVALYFPKLNHWEVWMRRSPA
jgi:hypothetical protein